MARPLRIQYPGAVYHVMSRGNAQQLTYLSDSDRIDFLNILRRTVKKYNWLCHSYCLMGNHYHLLIETIDPNLSLGMRQLNGIYTQRFNKRHNRVGHLFQGRFKAILVEKELYLLELCRYIVLNPVRANIVKQPEEYRWSSYIHIIVLDKNKELLTTDWILSQFSKNYQDAIIAYKKFIHAGINKLTSLPNKTGQIIMGSKNFISKIECFLKKKADIKEVPRKQRYAHRPQLEKLLLEKNISIKKIRNKQIIKYHTEYAYTISEISRLLKLHYSTISKVLKIDKTC